MPIPRDTFTKHLDQQALTSGTRGVYRSMFNKITQQIQGSDLQNLIVLQDFRASMGQGQRNIFDATWHHLTPVAAQHGITLPEIPAIPRMRLTHPLQPDLTLLSGVFGNHGVCELTWREGRAAESNVREACSRVYSFQTGKTPHGVPDETRIVVNGPDHQPMQQWRVEYIINSAGQATQGHVERASEQFFAELTVARVNGTFLRDVAVDLWRARNRLERRKDAAQVLESWLDIIRRRHFLGFRSQLQKLADPAFETRPVPW